MPTYSLVTAHLSRAAHDTLRAYATHNDRSISYCVRWAVEEWLIRNTTWRPPGWKPPSKVRPLGPANGAP